MAGKTNKYAKLQPQEFYKEAIKTGQAQQVIKYLMRHFFNAEVFNENGFSLNDIDQHMTSRTKSRNAMRISRLAGFVGLKKDENGHYIDTLSDEEKYVAIAEHLTVAEMMALQLYSRNLKAMIKAHQEAVGVTSDSEKRRKRREYMRKYRAEKAKKIAEEQAKLEKQFSKPQEPVTPVAPKHEAPKPQPKVQPKPEPKPQPQKEEQSNSTKALKKLQRREGMDVLGGHILTSRQIKNLISSATNTNGQTFSEGVLMLAKREQGDTLESDIMQTIKVAKGSLEKDGVNITVKQATPNLHGILKPYEGEYGKSMNGEKLYNLRALEMLLLESEEEQN